MKSLLRNQEYETALMAWKHAKKTEQEANAARLAAEEAILVFVKDDLRNTGTSHFEGGLKIITALDQRWDNKTLNEAHGEFIQRGINFPFEVTWKPDSKKIDDIRNNNPDVYQEFLLPALTVRPRKPGFSIKESE